MQNLKAIKENRRRFSDIAARLTKEGNFLLLAQSSLSASRCGHEQTWSLNIWTYSCCGSHSILGISKIEALSPFQFVR